MAVAYLAKWDDGSAYLAMDTQMETYLSKGASIYRVEDETETLIATPERGFITERPVFPTTGTYTPPEAGEYAAAGRILLGLED